MHHGCPVLASNIKVFHEVSKNSINFFEEGDENSLVDQLIKLLSGNLDFDANKKNLKLITIITHGKTVLARHLKFMKVYNIKLVCMYNKLFKNFK